MKLKTLNEHLRDDPRTHGVSLRFKFLNGRPATGNQAFRKIEVWVNRKKVGERELTAAQSKSVRSKTHFIKAFILFGVSKLPKKAAPKKKPKVVIPKKSSSKVPGKLRILDPDDYPQRISKKLILQDNLKETVKKTIYSKSLERPMAIYKKKFELSHPFRFHPTNPKNQIAHLKEMILEKALAFYKSSATQGKKEYLIRFNHREHIYGGKTRWSGWGMPRMRIRSEDTLRDRIEFLMSCYLTDMMEYLRGYATIAITGFSIEAGA